MDLNKHEFYMHTLCEKGMGKAGSSCIRITNPSKAVRDCKSRTVSVDSARTEGIIIWRLYILLFYSPRALWYEGIRR